MTKYYTAIIFLNVFAMIVVQVCIKKSNTLTEGRKKLFCKLFNAIIIAAVCEWLGNYLQGTGSATRTLHIMVKAVEFSVAPAIGFFTAMIIERRHTKAIYIFLGIHAALEWLSGLGGFIYRVDEFSHYSHGEFYFLYILAYLLSIAYGVYVVLKNVKKYQYNGIGYFLLIVVFMLTGIVMQLYDSSLKVDYVTVGIASMMLYIFTLEMITQTDELTELINRRGYENYISHIEEKCVILFFDVDNFKTINDTYGHALGDKVLSDVGRAIKMQYAKYGKCFRFGGDEFCAVLTKNTNQIEKMNEDFLKTVAGLREKESRMPSVSIGYADFNPDSQNIKDAIEEADKMMYRFKEEYKQHNKTNSK